MFAVDKQVWFLNTLVFIQLSQYSQGPQPSSLEDGWVHNTQKTWEFYFGPFQSFHLVTHWEKAIKIG